MDPSRSRLLEWLTLGVSRSLVRRHISDLNETLSPAAMAELLESVQHDCSNLDTSRLNNEVVQKIFSPEAMICHPLLIHFIRPATRMAHAHGHTVNCIPIVCRSGLRFAGRVTTLDRNNIMIVEIPLGSIIHLREIGLAIINLHNAIEYGQTEKVQLFSRVCRSFSALLFEPAPLAFEFGKIAFKNISTSYRLYSSQVTHVIGVFLILHELGHICKQHATDPNNDEQLRQQELAADAFAMECLFSTRKNDPKFERFRIMRIIYVCHLFSIFEVGLNDLGVELDGYPSFAKRREALLTHFQSGSEVVRSVINFNNAITDLPRPEFHPPQS